MLADHELDDLILACDPLADVAPARGSDRRAAVIGEVIGGQSVATARRPRRWWLGAVAAGVAGAAVGAVTLRPGSEPSAKAAIIEAADNLGDLRSFEVDVFSDETPLVHSRYADGAFESGELRPDGTLAVTTAIVDGYEYTIDPGGTARQVAQYEHWPSNYGPAARAVLALMMATTEPQARGRDTVSGLDAELFDIEMSPEAADTIGQLHRDALAWFELEWPYGVDRISVWVADDLIVQIEAHFAGSDTTGPEETRRTTFSNFNGDITITAPPGPYAEQSPVLVPATTIAPPSTDG